MKRFVLYPLGALVGALLGLYMLFPIPVFGDEVSTWSTTAGNNNSASPDGWPENMAPSGVNDSAREVMAAIKRWYDDIQPSIVTTGSGGSYAFAASQTIATYATGQVFSFIASFPATGGVTFNVDSVGAKDIVKADGSAVTANDIVTGQHVVVSYSATNDHFQLLSTIGSGGLSSPVAVADGGTGATDAGTARTNLGVAIGSDVQAHDTGLDGLASAATTAGNIAVGNGTTWVALAASADNSVLISDSNSATGVTWSVPALSEVFQSAEQTIIGTGGAGSSFVVTHGLSATPDLIKVVLINKTADCGWSPGAELDMSNLLTNASDRGIVTAVTNATQIYGQYGANANPFIGPELDNPTGAFCAFTNANWRVVIRAYN